MGFPRVPSNVFSAHISKIVINFQSFLQLISKNFITNISSQYFMFCNNNVYRNYRRYSLFISLFFLLLITKIKSRCISLTSVVSFSLFRCRENGFLCLVNTLSGSRLKKCRKIEKLVKNILETIGRNFIFSLLWKETISRWRHTWIEIANLWEIFNLYFCSEDHIKYCKIYSGYNENANNKIKTKEVKINKNN